MKNIFLITVITTLLSFTSCNIYQDITFKEDGAVSYKMMVDLSEMMKMAPISTEALSKEGLDKDTTLSLVEFIKENARKEEKKLSKDELALLKDMEDLFLHVSTDEENSELKVSIFGDFNNTDDLNKALFAMEKSDAFTKNEKDKTKKDMLTDAFYSHVRYKWDGKKMQAIIEKAKDEEENEEELTNSDIAMMNSMFSGGKAKISYHFPQRIKNVSNPDAVFSQDGKTVILNYSFAEMLKKAADQNITIEIE